MSHTNIYDLDLPQWVETLKQWQQPAFRAKQIWNGLYKQYWSQPEQFLQLPAPLRQKLEESFDFKVIEPALTLDSSDGQTRKTLFRLHDGRQIEAVLMRYEDRRTLCISTQVGCAMGCTFCATGQMGFKRHLSSGEIVAQVIHYARLLRESNEQVTNVVVMGMGEPFHNYDNTLAAIDRLNHPEGCNLGARRFTISTSGLIPAIQRFASEKRQINLAISLHASVDEARSAVMPVNRRYPIADLITACREYVESTGRRVTFEWALIHGVTTLPRRVIKTRRAAQRAIVPYQCVPLNQLKVSTENPPPTPGPKPFVRFWKTPESRAPSVSGAGLTSRLAAASSPPKRRRNKALAKSAVSFAHSNRIPDKPASGMKRIYCGVDPFPKSVYL